MQAELLVLRVVHVMGGVFWVGGVTLLAFFVFPSVAAAGPGGGQVMAGMVQRKLLTIMPVVAVVTMLAGLRLLQRVSAGFSAEYFSSTAGMMQAVSALLAIGAFVYGILVSRPAAARIAELGHLMTSAETEREKLAAEMRAMQTRAGFALKVTAVLLLLSALGMSVARYV